MKLDRSRIETRLNCKIKRYWSYDHLGTGIKVDGPRQHADIGQAVHTGISGMLTGRSLDWAITEALMELTESSQEDRFLVEMILRVFWWTGYSRIMNEFDIIETEVEREVEIYPGVTLMLRRDCLARRKIDGQLVVIDFKTLGYYVESWELLLENSLQTLLYTKATEILSGERCTGVQYEGLVKGKFTKDGWQSPLVYGYTNGEEWQPTYTNRKGWRKELVMLHMDAEAWHRCLLQFPDMYGKLFQTVVPRRPPDHVMEQDIKQLCENELLYERFLQKGNGDRFRFLEKNRDNCFKYGTNYPCEFYALCFGADDHLGSKEIPQGYVVREPHHESERN